MITYEFQVPPTYMPPDYRDGMRGLGSLNPGTETSGGGGIFGRHDPAAMVYGSRQAMVPYDTRGPQLAGGIFRGSLGSLGDAASDLKGEVVSQFNQKNTRLRNEVLLAQSQHFLAASAAGRPGDVVTFQNNVASLDRIAGQIRAGDLHKIPAYVGLANALISLARETSDARWWINLPTVEELVRGIAALPQWYADALVALAKTTGTAAGELLRNAGIDPAKVIDTAGSTAKWIGLGAVALAAIYLASR